VLLFIEELAKTGQLPGQERYSTRTIEAFLIILDWEAESSSTSRSRCGAIDVCKLGGHSFVPFFDLKPPLCPAFVTPNGRGIGDGVVTISSINAGSAVDLRGRCDVWRFEIAAGSENYAFQTNCSSDPGEL
jgi:hypothetical protein